MFHSLMKQIYVVKKHTRVTVLMYVPKDWVKLYLDKNLDTLGKLWKNYDTMIKTMVL